MALLAHAVLVELARLVVTGEVEGGANGRAGIGRTFDIPEVRPPGPRATVRVERAWTPFFTKRPTESTGPIDARLGQMGVEPTLSGDGSQVDRRPLRDVDELEVDDEELERHHVREAEDAASVIDRLVDEAGDDESGRGSGSVADEDEQIERLVEHVR